MTIRQLHEQYEQYLRLALENITEIGGLLSEQKSELKECEWPMWARVNLPFSLQLAQEYLRLYKIRKELQSMDVGDLTVAFGPIFKLEPERARP